MKNYKTEGGIDFYAELYKSLDEESPSLNDDNICLISKLPLTDNFVKLNCGHKFNYIPLCNDISNHKLKFNMLESTAGYLKKTQIRCPYCRAKQNGLLPYYENMKGVKKIEYVNYFDESKMNTNDNYKFGKCLCVVDNANFNVEQPESVNNPKFITCLANTHLFKVLDGSTGEYVYYCASHKYSQMKKNTIMAKEKAKQEKADLKQKAKEEKLKAKELLKNEKLEAKKTAKKILVNQNVCSNY